MQTAPQPANSNANSSVELSGISLRLPVDSGGELQILSDISLTLPAGVKCGLVGPSGSGKTSLLTIIAGLRRPSGGKLSLLGSDTGGMDEEELARFRRDNIGVIFQSFHLLPAMTALENVAMPLELAGREDAEQKAGELLGLVGLEHRLTHFPNQLSGGEQQRVAIARAFVARPRLILADEPTGNLDGETSAHVMEMLNEMATESNSTMLLITHNNDLLEDVSMVARMKDGNLAVDA